MTYLTLQLEEDFRNLEPYKTILPKSKEFSDLQDALKFCQESNIVFACFITQCDGDGDTAEIEYQCSMLEVEQENEAGEFYHDLSYM